MNKQVIQEMLEEKYGAFVSRKSLADELNVSPQTIRRAELAKKLIPLRLSSRCLRYPVSSAASYIASGMEIGEEEI